MRNCPKPEYGNRLTEDNEVNEGPNRRTRGALAGSPASFPDSLRSLRLLLCNSVRPAALFAVLALFPATAQAQEAIEAWVQRYDGHGDRIDSYVKDMAVDAGGNVYVTGELRCNDPPGVEGGTIKYSSAGVPLWTNYYGWGQVYAIAVDAKGDVVVTGVELDIATVKYSSEGVPLWTNRSYHTPASSSSDPQGMAVDANGNVFVAGWTSGASVGDYLVLKYSSAGALLWTRIYTSGPGDTMDIAHAMAVDAHGNVVVTGRCADSPTSGSDYLTIKYSNAGELLWTQRYNGPGSPKGPGTGYDDAWALAVDGEGNIIVTGMSESSTATTYIPSYATIKYSSTGEPIWTNRYDENWAAFGQAMAVDASGNVFVTGPCDGAGRSVDYLTLKYSSAGVPLWTNRYHQPGNYWLDTRDLASDPYGNVFVTGSALDMDASPDTRRADIVTVAYSGAGTQLWTRRYSGPGNTGDRPDALGADANGSVYVAGGSQAGTYPALDTDYVIIKYVTPPFITRQPLSCTNAVGTTASFSVEAMGGTPLSYQWRRDGTNLVEGGNLRGVTTTNLSINNVQLEDACDYTVVVTNEWGSATSVAAHLTVTIPPSAGRFTNLAYSPLTGFSFIFRDGTVGQSYRIQRSPSMAQANWVDWLNFTYTEPMTLTDGGAAGATSRFYRAVTP